MEHFKKSVVCIRNNYNRTKCKYIDIPLLILFTVVAFFIATDAPDLLPDPLRKYFFPIFSVFVNLLIYKMIQMIMSINNIRLEKYQWLLIVCAFAGAFVSYVVIILSRDFIYYWDFSNYIIKQYDTEKAFTGSVVSGIKYLLLSFTGDYTNFINIFTEVPFCLTSKTGDAYVLSQLVNIFIPVSVLLGMLISKMSDILQVKNKRMFFVISFLMSVSFPMLHNASFLGQPDWFGVIFCLVIVILTIDYKFEKFDISLCFVLFAATACLILTRRWYLYFIVGYYFSYAFILVLNMIKVYRIGDKATATKSFKNLLIFGISSVFFMCVIFFRIIENVLMFDYAERYAHYSVYGFFSEIIVQSINIGVFILVIIVLGVLNFLLTKKYIGITLTNLFGYILSFSLFHHVQNFGRHQSLLLISYYFVLLFIGVAVIVDFKNKITRKFGVALCILCLGLSPIFTDSIVSDAVTAKLGATDIVMSKLGITEKTGRSVEETIYFKANRNVIGNVSEWINNNCSDDEFVYIIPHDPIYNPDKFINVNLPERNIANKVSFGFDVNGTHKFPTDIFEAKYILTCEPFAFTKNTYGLSKRLNNLFLSIKDEKFVLAKTFDMGDGYTFYAYERVVPVDMEEIECYLIAFDEEDKQFPDMYSEVVEEYIANNEDLKDE